MRGSQLTFSPFQARAQPQVGNTTGFTQAHKHLVTIARSQSSFSSEVLSSLLLPPVPYHCTTLLHLCSTHLCERYHAEHELACQVMATRTQHSFSPFKLGDKVWLEARNLKCSVVNPKFTPKREGPFTITKVLSLIVYQLHLPKTWKIHPVFHASLLSPYHENTVHGPNFPSPPPDLIDGEEEYEVEKILCHCGTPSKHSFLIRWKGYLAEEDSWIPERQN